MKNKKIIAVILVVLLLITLCSALCACQSIKTVTSGVVVGKNYGTPYLVDLGPLKVPDPRPYTTFYTVTIEQPQVGMARFYVSYNEYVNLDIGDAFVVNPTQHFMV